MISHWTAWLGDTAFSQYIQQNSYAFPLLEVAHVLSISLVVGSIFIVDLRLVNWCSKSYRVTRLLRAVLPITVIAFCCALVTGGSLFASQPARYLATPVFLIKMGLLLVAGLNMLVFHVWTQRGIAHWDEGDAIPARARVAGFASMLLWVAILFAGRVVGFMLSF